MIKVESQQDLDILLDLPFWEESFFREMYLISSSYIQDGETIAPDSAPSVLILISTHNLDYQCIEMFFEEIEYINISFRCEMNPKAKYKNNRILFSFQSEQHDIDSRSLCYRILDKNCCGWKVRYGKKNFFDEGGFVISET